jgi:hypothetical protein
MSVWCQKLKSSMGAYVFRSAPNNGHRATTAACPKSANRRRGIRVNKMKEAANATALEQCKLDTEAPQHFTA